MVCKYLQYPDPSIFAVTLIVLAAIRRLSGIPTSKLSSTSHRLLLYLTPDLKFPSLSTFTTFIY